MLGQISYVSGNPSALSVCVPSDQKKKRCAPSPRCFLRVATTRRINFIVNSSSSVFSTLSVCTTRKLRQFYWLFRQTSSFHFYVCLTNNSNTFTSFTGRHYVPPFNWKLCSFNLLIVLCVIRVLQRCWLHVLSCLRLTTESGARA